jgi:hypothetical protein
MDKPALRSILRRSIAMATQPMPFRARQALLRFQEDIAR